MSSKFVQLLVVAGIVAGGWKIYQMYLTDPPPHRMGRQAMDVGDYGAASEWLEYAAQQDPENPAIQADLGACYFYLGQKARAASHYKAAASWLDMHSSSVEARRHKERAEILRQQGFY